MGASTSKATTIVDAEISSALSVFQNVVSENTTVMSQNNYIELHNCTLTDSAINQGNYAYLDLASTVTATMDSKFQQDVQAAIKQAADSTAKAAIGMAASESAAVTRSITKISAAITQSIKNTISSQEVQSSIYKCFDSAHNNSPITQKNDVQKVIKLITTSSQMTEARQSAILDIAQEVKSLATGLDPTMLALIALAIVLAVGGIGVVGVNKAVNVLLSAKFWMLITLLIGLGGTGLALVRLGGDGTWPYKKGDKARNKTVLTVAGVLAGMGFIGAGATGYLVYMTEKKA